MVHAAGPFAPIVFGSVALDSAATPPSPAPSALAGRAGCPCCRAIDNELFFQVEGGIRDYKVTGVQTCALPISGVAGVEAPVQYGPHFRGLALYLSNQQLLRSEERRVGKECRSRWSPYH